MLDPASLALVLAFILHGVLMVWLEERRGGHARFVLAFGSIATAVICGVLAYADTRRAGIEVIPELMLSRHSFAFAGAIVGSGVAIPAYFLAARTAFGAVRTTVVDYGVYLLAGLAISLAGPNGTNITSVNWACAGLALAGVLATLDLSGLRDSGSMRTRSSATGLALATVGGVVAALTLQLIETLKDDIDPMALTSLRAIGLALVFIVIDAYTEGLPDRNALPSPRDVLLSTFLVAPPMIMVTLALSSAALSPSAVGLSSLCVVVGSTATKVLWNGWSTVPRRTLVGVALVAVSVVLGVSTCSEVSAESDGID